jgi:hypothetical protein
VTTAREQVTGETVKRAAPGAEGLVVDPFSRSAVRRFLRGLAPLFRIPRMLRRRPRMLFTDSYEVFRADYSPGLFAAFAARRGYDLVPWLRYLDDHREPALSRRLLHDYRRTMEELYHQASLRTWKRWSHRRGMKVRLQAHGSPAALVDAYATADVPETEAFGRQGLIAAVAGMASSAAKLAGRKLCSAEIFTWMDDHFRQSLDGMRRWADDFFLAGINHVFFHGWPSTPAGVPFPGHLFYAATNVSEHMPWFRHLLALTDYITRIQALLQEGSPDAEILLYFPIHDVFASLEGSAEEGESSRLRLCSVARAEEWFERDAAATWRAVHDLRAGAYQLDFASDALVQSLRVRGGRLAHGRAAWSVLLFAGCRLADERTLVAASRLARAGAAVWFLGGFPAAAGRAADPRQPWSESIELQRLAENGTVRVLDRKEDIRARLAREGVRGEQLDGFSFIRRAAARGGTTYFLRWNGASPWHGNVRFAAKGSLARTCDPVTGEISRVRTDPVSGGVSVPLSVEAGRTVVVTIAGSLPGGLPAHAPHEPRRHPGGRARQAIRFDGPWVLTWEDPAGTSRSVPATTLSSWTELAELGMHSGLVTYTTSLRLDHATIARHRWALDLGDVRESADVTLNGEPVGIAWTRPFSLAIPDGLLREENQLMVRVANLPANRIIDMDRRGIRWRTFFFVDIDYEPFDASGWKPVPSGLLGPVTLVPGP